ncbi:uncharacterized protein LOC112166695 [Rosa chinensis]|uniref:uncharacterized protein LOC112166695 n=1 Tax=Rosa chinensis TaxID=74649 RepID=UPI000D09395E|nr:uncharacterized protein LOC112166695 [Rosa chinensis]
MLQGKIIVWNCRGIVNNETQRALINIVQARKPSLIFLSEILARKELIDQLTRSLGFKDSICFPQQHESQGLALIWSDDIHAELRSKSANHIDVVLGKPDETKKWRFTGIYGFAARSDRNRTWSLIKTLANETYNLPWLIAGDFNEIMMQADKSGGPPRAQAPMTQFRSTMTSCGFIDLGYVGSRYTWSNKFIKERLDRGFQTVRWRDWFPFSRVITLDPSDSDHCPLLIGVNLDKSRHRRKARLFRFEESWHGNSYCRCIIQRHWAQLVTGNALQQLDAKIRATGQELMDWHIKEFENHKVELKVIQEKLTYIMKAPYSPEQYEEQRSLHVKQNQLLTQQEKYRRQRSRAIWLKEGDQNSAYFHRRASNRRSKNTIKGLTNESGEWSSEPDDIKRLLLTYFQGIFHSESSNTEAIQTVLAATPSKVTAAMNESLMQPYSDEEIKKALFQRHPSKSPGSDGMSPFFYQKYWDMVSLDVCNAVRNSLEKGEFWQHSNFTYLCLIPKIKDSKEAAHFLPIALCNVICQIISKVIANRLKHCLPDIISPL